MPVYTKRYLTLGEEQQMNILHIKSAVKKISQVALVLAAAMPATALADEVVKGPNVHYVQCRDDNGHAQQFSQVGPQQWAFFNRAGQSKSFAETNRDEWSVYLKSADGMTAQLDLWQKTCTIAKPDGTVATADKVAYAHTM